jgi:hypothetical protein
MGVVDTFASAVVSSPRAFGLGVGAGLLAALYYRYKFTNLKKKQNQGPMI